MSIGFLCGIRGSSGTKRNDMCSDFYRKCHELRLKGYSPKRVRQIMEKAND